MAIEMRVGKYRELKIGKKIFNKKLKQEVKIEAIFYHQSKQQEMVSFDYSLSDGQWFTCPKTDYDDLDKYFVLSDIKTAKVLFGEKV
jgi:hypothetical protein